MASGPKPYLRVGILAESAVGSAHPWRPRSRPLHLAVGLETHSFRTLFFSATRLEGATNHPAVPSLRAEEQRDVCLRLIRAVRVRPLGRLLLRDADPDRRPDVTRLSAFSHVAFWREEAHAIRREDRGMKEAPSSSTLQ